MSPTLWNPAGSSLGREEKQPPRVEPWSIPASLPGGNAEHPSVPLGTRGLVRGSPRVPRRRGGGVCRRPSLHYAGEMPPSPPPWVQGILGGCCTPPRAPHTSLLLPGARKPEPPEQLSGVRPASTTPPPPLSGARGPPKPLGEMQRATPLFALSQLLRQVRSELGAAGGRGGHGGGEAPSPLHPCRGGIPAPKGARLGAALPREPVQRVNPPARQVGTWEDRAGCGRSPGWREQVAGDGVQPGAHGYPGAGTPTPPPRSPHFFSPGVPSRSPGSELAMRRLEEDSEVYKMLQENRELRAAPRQSSTFRLLQEALEDEGGGERGGISGVCVWGGSRWGGSGGTLMASSPRSQPRSPLPQPALAQRPQARGRRPEAAHLREVRQHHRVSGAGGPGGVFPEQDPCLPSLPAGPIWG